MGHRLAAEHTQLLVSPEQQAIYAAHLKDRLLALAEALGCIPMESPEQGRWGQKFTLDPDEVVSRIEGFGASASDHRIAQNAWNA
jgi:hypothetical protein